MKRIIIALCMLYLFGGNLSAKVVLPQILSDHAVLQQQTEVKLWGKAVPNTTVNVTPSWNNQTITAQSDNEGYRLLPPISLHTVLSFQMEK